MSIMKTERIDRIANNLISLACNSKYKWIPGPYDINFLQFEES